MFTIGKALTLALLQAVILGCSSLPEAPAAAPGTANRPSLVGDL